MMIAWDFDGVPNPNHDRTRYVWTDAFEEKFGKPFAGVGASVFGDRTVITGAVDLKDRLADWIAHTGTPHRAEDVLAYWLEMGTVLDPELIALVDALNAAGTRQVIATNNEARRATYIADCMGLAARVDRIFPSGSIGVAKPDPGYYAPITVVLEADPSEVLLVDDKAENVEAAMGAGWQGFHFTRETRGELIARLRL